MNGWTHCSLGSDAGYRRGSEGVPPTETADVSLPASAPAKLSFFVSADGAVSIFLSECVCY